MDSVWGFIGVIAFACGIYGLYAYIQMKKTGEINATLLLGKEYMYKKCKDKETYMKKTKPAVLIFSAAALVYGVVDLIHCYAYSMPVVDTVLMILFLAVIVWFAIYTTKLKRKYF